MSLGFEKEKEFGNLLRSLTRNAIRHTEPLRLKYAAAHGIRIEEDAHLYSHDQVRQAEYYLQATMHKYLLAQVSLEQLWALSYDRRDRMIDDALDRSLQRLTADDEETLGIAFGLEQFLLVSRTLIDFVKLYICRLLRAPHKGSMSSKSFMTALERIADDDPRATPIRDYFAASEESWMKTLVSLRDKVAHRDKVRPVFKSGEALPTGDLFDWPTIQGLTYDRFCQSMKNGMFEMLVDLFPLLYAREWIAGPYRPGMFAAEREPAK